jgi:predicted DsbA family dithiol-disulfide isomerase
VSNIKVCDNPSCDWCCGYEQALKDVIYELKRYSWRCFSDGELKPEDWLAKAFYLTEEEKKKYGIL